MTDTRFAIRFAPGLREKMLASVGRLPPEHYAALGGSLDDPFHVTSIHPLPPAADERGRSRASSTHVTLNASYLEYVLNTELVPFGKFFLGVMHSHPGGVTSLSGGRTGSGQGDIPSMRSHLENAARQGIPWAHYLAPIVTHPGDNPQVTGWIIRLDEPDPIPADIRWEAVAPAPHDAPSAAVLPAPLALVQNRLAVWQEAISEAEAAALAEGDRQFNADVLRHFRRIDIEAQARKFADRHGVTPKDRNGARAPLAMLNQPKRGP